MTANITNRVTESRNSGAKIGSKIGKLRNQLFLSSALLTSALIAIAAWTINSQVIGQVRQQVQAEVETLLPIYDAVWDEHARRLGATGTTVADSPIVKLIFGNAAASRDERTLREMIADVAEEALKPGDLVLISDGDGQVFFTEKKDGAKPEVNQIDAARAAAESQKQSRGFTMIGGRLFHLVATPVLLHSGSDDINNVQSVISIGEEVNQVLTDEIKRRMHSEIVFLLEDKLYASSLAAENQAMAFNAIRNRNIPNAASARPTEISVGGETHLAFARPLTNFDGKQIGQVVMLRSMAEAGKLFRAISNLLLLLWTMAIIAALGLSYLVAGRITRPLEKLVVSAKELGQGNYDVVVPTAADGEIAQLANAFDQMRGSLRQTQAALLKNERLATIGQMASSIIHDLRNPLATISTAAEVLKNEGLSLDRRQTMLDTQLRAATRMNGMLSELLEFSRGSYKLDLQRLPLATVVERSVQELNGRVSLSGTTLITDVPPEIQVSADEEKLGRVFENLMVNSLQAFQQGNQPNRAIQILAKATADGIQVQVTDNGPGIPASIRDRLFEPFISSGKQGGTGLGLAIARGIVEAHGGKISLADSADGARFVIQLPLELPQGGMNGSQSFAG